MAEMVSEWQFKFLIFLLIFTSNIETRESELPAANISPHLSKLKAVT
jgi:hypothetical protein